MRSLLSDLDDVAGLFGEVAAPPTATAAGSFDFELVLRRRALFAFCLSMGLALTLLVVGGEASRSLVPDALRGLSGPKGLAGTLRGSVLPSASATESSYSKGSSRGSIPASCSMAASSENSFGSPWPAGVGAIF